MMSSIGTDACGWSEANMVKSVLVFMKENMTADEAKILKDLKDPKGKITVMQVCADVEDRCMNALLVPEGKTERGKEKPFVTGFASRLTELGKGIGGSAKKLKREAAVLGGGREEEEEDEEGAASNSKPSVGGFAKSVANFFKAAPKEGNKEKFRRHYMRLFVSS